MAVSYSHQNFSTNIVSTQSADRRQETCSCNGMNAVDSVKDKVNVKSINMIDYLILVSSNQHSLGCSDSHIEKIFFTLKYYGDSVPFYLLKYRSRLVLSHVSQKSLLFVNMQPSVGSLEIAKVAQLVGSLEKVKVSHHACYQKFIQV